MDIKLEKGKALVLFGARQCGKTSMAKKIAEAHGKYAHITMSELFGTFNSAFIRPDINTVIVEGFIDNPRDVSKIKSIISEKNILINTKGKNPEVGETPHFIFCTGDKKPIQITLKDRRFTTHMYTLEG